jgi:hypothetical protein
MIFCDHEYEIIDSTTCFNIHGLEKLYILEKCGICFDEISYIKDFTPVGHMKEWLYGEDKT